MAEIRVENLVKRFGSVTAVADLSLEIRKGEMVALLGPSGCGKTTLLRMLAGFEHPTEGHIYMDGERINDLPPQQRRIGIVFQDYAIFPTMTVYDNVAYGLKIKKLPRERIRKEVEEYLGLVGLSSYGERMPSQLSGGQQQRVALARALINKPEVLLLDEPLSNLDAALRLRIRKEIRKLQQSLNITAVFVTHDQEEALSIADKIFVMREGELMQSGGPDTIYTRPANDFIADFIGRSNVMYGRVLAGVRSPGCRWTGRYSRSPPRRGRGSLRRNGSGFPSALISSNSTLSMGSPRTVTPPWKAPMRAGERSCTWSIWGTTPRGRSGSRGAGTWSSSTTIWIRGRGRPPCTGDRRSDTKFPPGTS